MRHKAFLVFPIFLMPFCVAAQFIFQNLKWQDGLSAKEVRCLYKDNEGFLWIGTSNGLNRYDGAIVKQYKNSLNQKGLYINAIEPLADSDNLLIGTRQGLRFFNKRTGIYKTDTAFGSLNNEPISMMRHDDSHRLWIGTSTKIFIYDKGKIQPVTEYIPEASIIKDQIFTLSAFEWDDYRKGFWIGGALSYFIDCKNKKVYNKENNPLHIPLLDTSEVYAIAVDKEHNIWYGCNKNRSLNYWDHKTNTVRSYFELDNKKINEGCSRIFIDSKERIWISTWAYAAFIKEPGKPFKKIPYSQTQTYSIAYGFFRDAIEDIDGNVILGTINGVSKNQLNGPLQSIYKLPSFDFFLETGFAHANYITIENDTIIACKEDGIIIYNMNDRSYLRYIATTATDPRNRFVMAAKANNIWWFAGVDGIYYMQKGSTTLKRFDLVKKDASDRDANFIFTDNTGKLWFEILNDALYRYDPISKKCDRFDGKDPAHGLFNFNNGFSFLQLKNNKILFAKAKTGFLQFDINTDLFSVIPVPDLNNIITTKLLEDNKGNIWASTLGKGIVELNLKGQCIDSINSANGLLYDYITNVSFDEKGTLWASSREGLMFINPANKTVTKVDIDLGQTLQDYWNYITVANGKVYAVMLDHVVVIDPLHFAASPVKKPPHITSVKIFDEERTGIETDGTLQLSPNDDYITFQFASLNHRDIPSLQYSYQLEGVDKGWINAERALSASYNNIGPGTYTFKVRSTDENGQWMNTYTSLKIHIHPHWWQTWWFNLLVGLIICSILFMFYRSKQSRKRQKRIERTIDYFANSVYGENSVTEICWDIARNCISQLHFEDSVVYLLDEDKKRLIQKAAFGPKNPKGNEIADPIEIEIGKGIVGSAAASGKTLIIPDTTKDERYIVDDEVRLSEIAVPILHEGKVIGVIDSEHHQRNFFTEEHAKALSTIASISATKIAEAMAEAQAQEKEIKLLEINKMLAESQLMALRAQMNPHFVFNCLNSIQECIVTEKYGEASKYLNKFSKLFRMVLNNSGKNLVTVEEEEEVLELYLELEAMRFELSFSYELIMDDELEKDEILIPSMLVQPYVENALWHGLMHKNGERKLLIQFKRINEELFQCIIDDNGIGRKKALELKEQNSKTKRHQSKGLQITKDRLDILQRQGQHATINIEDKYDDNGNATGTRVVIELSTFLQTN